MVGGVGDGPCRFAEFAADLACPGQVAGFDEFLKRFGNLGDVLGAGRGDRVEGEVVTAARGQQKRSRSPTATLGWLPGSARHRRTPRADSRERVIGVDAGFG